MASSDGGAAGASEPLTVDGTLTHAGAAHIFEMAGKDTLTLTEIDKFWAKIPDINALGIKPFYIDVKKTPKKTMNLKQFWQKHQAIMKEWE